jgi:hypothetical protein
MTAPAPAAHSGCYASSTVTTPEFKATNSTLSNGDQQQQQESVTSMIVFTLFMNARSEGEAADQIP